ncbi:LysR family transcriptional regulator [uncultured Roseobacter sp.]|uniref:LysR family transcriptional regulator n=1 Tax=uncultured Roseobacter sp. TaxID=114847 RepID=UPI002620A151|nr:LysR family transcriptional regulator [uncultured Roseobacter sp.]
MADHSLRNVPLDWVRAFEIAGRTGSFTAAARESNVTQASISQRISNLEKRIGAQLFVRNARGVTLSVQGEAWLPYVSGALRSLDESCEELFGILQDKITISASASVNELWMSPRLCRWQSETRSQIVLSTIVLQADTGLLDATIRVQYGLGAGEEYHRAPLFAEQLSPVATPALMAGRTSWTDLDRLGVSGPRPGWQAWSRHTGDPLTPVPKIRFDSFSAALSAALSGAGVLLASLPLCADLLERGTLVRLSDHVLEPPETYWMMARKDRLTRSQWHKVAKVFALT